VPAIEMEHREVVVIGAGPSGAIAAALLKRNGHDVLIVERQHFPRFSIGESLLSHCLDFVEEAGMLDAVNAAGFQLKNGAAFAWGEHYSAFDFGQTFSNGKPPPSRSSAPTSTNCWRIKRPCKAWKSATARKSSTLISTGHNHNCEPVAKTAAST